MLCRAGERGRGGESTTDGRFRRLGWRFNLYTTSSAASRITLARWRIIGRFVLPRPDPPSRVASGWSTHVGDESDAGK